MQTLWGSVCVWLTVHTTVLMRSWCCCMDSLSSGSRTDWSWITHLPTQITSPRCRLKEAVLGRSQFFCSFTITYCTNKLKEVMMLHEQERKRRQLKRIVLMSFLHFIPFFDLFFFFSLSPSAGLSSSDPSELPQPGHPVRPEVAEAGGRAGGGEARGSGGLSEGSGDEGGVWAAEGGDEAAAEQPEGEGQCLFTQILVNHNSDVSNWEKGSNQSEHVYILVAVWPQPDSGVAPNQQCVHHHLYPRNTNSQKIHLDLNKGLVTTEYRTGLAQMLTQLVDFYQHDSLSLNKRRAECHIVGPILTPQCFCTHHQLVVCLSPVTNSY